VKDLLQIKDLLRFMQKEDRNGSWMEWYDEIERGESEFDKEYVRETLQSWYEESRDQKYLDRISTL